MTESKDASLQEEDFTEVNQDGWEDVLGSGRIRKKVIKEGTKGSSLEGLGRPNRGDVVRVKLRGISKDGLAALAELSLKK